MFIFKLNRIKKSVQLVILIVYNIYIKLNILRLAMQKSMTIDFFIAIFIVIERSRLCVLLGLKPV